MASKELLERLNSALREENATLAAEVRELRKERENGGASLSGAVGDVMAFHLATDTPVISSPVFPTEERVRLRERLIAEEYGETIEAIRAGDIVETADGLVDLIYVCIGAAIEFGIPLDAVWDEVHRSNMAKAGGPRRADGKIMKPEGWTRPDVAGILDAVMAAQRGEGQ